HIDALAPHVSKIVVKDLQRASSLLVDGTAVGPDGVVEVDGGEHVLRAELPGAPTWEQRISVATKDDVRVIDLPPPAPPPAAASPSVAAEPAHRGPHTRTASYVV